MIADRFRNPLATSDQRPEHITYLRSWTNLECVDIDIDIDIHINIDIVVGVHIDVCIHIDFLVIVRGVLAHFV